MEVVGCLEMEGFVQLSFFCVFEVYFVDPFVKPFTDDKAIGFVVVITFAHLPS